VTALAATTLLFTPEACCADTRARTGSLRLGRGTIQTPVFMPVGTQGTVKAVTPRDLEELGAEIILGNTYHLYLRPGHDLVASLGGLHRFMAWEKPILTDSGGFQVFSLGDLRKVEEEGVHFASHIDGSRHLLTPELSMQIQAALGSDIAMIFDECLKYPADRAATERSMELSLRWAARSRASHGIHGAASGQALFGIVQGGFEADIRVRSAQAIVDMGFDGYAVGGLSVGEGKELMHQVLEAVEPHLPESAPRYLMGVGLPIDLVEAVARGFDMFDCVMPTRHARTGSLFRGWGRINIKNARFRDDARPVEAGCSCYTCRNFSRAYLRHLFLAGEILGHHLNTVHNLHHYLALMRAIRTAIREGRFGAFYRQAVDTASQQETTDA